MDVLSIIGAVLFALLDWIPGSDWAREEIESKPKSYVV